MEEALKQATENFGDWWTELAEDLATATADERDLTVPWKTARRWILELTRTAPFDPQGPYEEALQRIQAAAATSFGQAKLGYLLKEEDVLGPLL